jgi:hypothetical protein
MNPRQPTTTGESVLIYGIKDYSISHGVSKVAKNLGDMYQAVEKHFYIGFSKDITEAKFNRLAAVWKSETSHLSMTYQKVEHPAYQKIIGIGKDALPYIFEDLSRNQSDWFWALQSITEVNPVKEEDLGNVYAMSIAWIAWGMKNGYVR